MILFFYLKLCDVSGDFTVVSIRPEPSHITIKMPIYDFEVENMFGAQYTFSISRVCGLMLIAIGNHFDLSISSAFCNKFC